MSESSGPPENAGAARVARRVGGAVVRFGPGQCLYRPGDEARGWIVVEKGRVRVSLTADTGRQVLLYRLSAGDTCLLTTSALMASERMLAEAVAETAVEALLVPAAAFGRLLGEDAGFRREVLRNYSERVVDLVVVVQDVLFHALPERLARLLLAQARDGRLETTHQAIAAELGSAREVISRALQRFEREGLLQIDRGHIRILDAAALEAVAAGGA
jgi:CRP/FNR family transcriptional regulator